MSAALSEVDRKFIAGLEAAVAERGEHYVYPSAPHSSLADSDYWRDGACVYSNRMGEAACIVGLAIEKSGIGVRPAYDAPASEASEVLVPMGVSNWVADATDHAQSKQDQGHEWGAVLDAFRVRLAEIEASYEWERQL